MKIYMYMYECIIETLKQYKIRCFQSHSYNLILVINIFIVSLFYFEFKRLNAKIICTTVPTYWVVQQRALTPIRIKQNAPSHQHPDVPVKLVTS